MEVGSNRLDDLREDVCSPVRESLTQSFAAVVQAAHHRLGNDPRDLAASYVIALSKLQKDSAQSCLDYLRHISSIGGEEAMGYRLAAYASLELDDVSAAREALEQAVRLKPQFADCWMLLGEIACREGDSDRAVDCFENGTLFASNVTEPALALAGLYRREGKLRKAIDTLRLAVAKDRRSAKLNLALGGLLRRRARRLERRRMPIARRKVIEEARRCYRTAMQAEVTSECCLQYGIFEQGMGDYEAAASLFRRAAELDPGSVAALAQLAHCSIDQGDIDTGLELFERVLSKSPGSAISHFRYTRAKKFRPGATTDEYVRQLRNLLQENHHSESALIHLNFALAKVLDDVGDYEHAWQHYDRANRLKPGHSKSRSTRAAKSSNTAERPLKRCVDISIELFSKQYFRERMNGGNQSDMPVFIIGMPRSGTTLTEQILSSHPDVAGAGELRWIDRLQRDLLSEYDSIEGASGRSSKGTANGNGADARCVEKPLSVPAERAERVGSFESLLPRLASLHDREVMRIADEYLTLLGNHRDHQRHVTDKMPTNFIHLGMIARMFPRATVIQCQRNPMDILVSNYCQHLSAPFCDMDQLVAYYEEYCRLMTHWRSVLPILIHVVQYERMIEDPESETRALVSHCGLPWDDSCLSFHQNKRAVHTPSKWQVRQPLYNTSVEKWRRFEPQLRPIAERLQASSQTGA